MHIQFANDNIAIRAALDNQLDVYLESTKTPLFPLSGVRQRF
jgi:hypothetical protein